MAFKYVERPERRAAMPRSITHFRENSGDKEHHTMWARAWVSIVSLAT